MDSEYSRRGPPIRPFGCRFRPSRTTVVQAVCPSAIRTSPSGRAERAPRRPSAQWRTAGRLATIGATVEGAPTAANDSEARMQDEEDNRIAPIAALLAMFLVTATIVALTFWSGDLFGPWTSVPPAAVEAGRIEALQPTPRAGGADGGAER